MPSFSPENSETKIKISILLIFLEILTNHTHTHTQYLTHQTCLQLTKFYQYLEKKLSRGINMHRISFVEFLGRKN